MSKTESNRIMTALALHKQEMIRQLTENIESIAAMTAEELFDFEHDLELHQGLIGESHALERLLGKLPYYMTCEECREHYHGCPVDEAEREAGSNDCYEYCKQQWLKAMGQ